MTDWLHFRLNAYLCIMRTSTARPRIMEAATTLFYNQGYMRTEISHVLKEARVARTTFYEHFHSKDELFVEYLTNKSNQIDRLLKAEVEMYETPREKVLGLFDFLTKLFAQPSYSGCSFLNVISDLPADSRKVKPIIKQQKDNVRNLFAEILQPVKKDNLADELYMLFDGALITNKIHDNPLTAISARNIAEKIL